MNFKPGDKVKCIDTDGCQYLKLNQIYTLVPDPVYPVYRPDRVCLGFKDLVAGITDTDKVLRRRSDRFIKVQSSRNLPDWW